MTFWGPKMHFRRKFLFLRSVFQKKKQIFGCGVMRGRAGAGGSERSVKRSCASERSESLAPRQAKREAKRKGLRHATVGVAWITYARPTLLFQDTKSRQLFEFFHTKIRISICSLLFMTIPGFSRPGRQPTIFPTTVGRTSLVCG